MGREIKTTKKRNAKGIKIGQVNQIEKKQCRDMKLLPIQVSTWVNGYFPGVGYFEKFKAITICVEKSVIITVQEGGVGSRKPIISISIPEGKFLCHNKKARECSKEPESPWMSETLSYVNTKD